jgi:hypothetical protein
MVQGDIATGDQQGLRAVLASPPELCPVDCGRHLIRDVPLALWRILVVVDPAAAKTFPVFWRGVRAESNFPNIDLDVFVT